MADNETELQNEVREFAQYNQQQISTSQLSTAISRAETHLVAEIGPLDDDFSWFDDRFPAREEAYFWTSLLFSKLSTGDLDAKSITTGAIKEKVLIANEDGEVTQWFANYKKYKNLVASQERDVGGRVTSASRTSDGGNRNYGR